MTSMSIFEGRNFEMMRRGLLNTFTSLAITLRSGRRKEAAFAAQEGFIVVVVPLSDVGSQSLDL